MSSAAVVIDALRVKEANIPGKALWKKKNE